MFSLTRDTQHINVDLRQGLAPISCFSGNTGFSPTNSPTLIKGDETKGTDCYAQEGHDKMSHRRVGGSIPLCTNLKAGTRATGVREHLPGVLAPHSGARGTASSQINLFFGVERKVEGEAKIPLSCLFFQFHLKKSTIE